MNINQILLCGDSDQFPLIFYYRLYENQSDFYLGWPIPISLISLLAFEWKSIRFRSGVPQSSFDFLLTCKWKSARFCYGLTQTNFLWCSVKIQMKANWTLLWASPEQVPLIFYQHLNKNQSDSALGWPRPISFNLVFNFYENQPDPALGWPRPSSSELLKSKWKSFRFCRYVCLCLVWLFGLRPLPFGKYEQIQLSRFV